MSRELTKRQLAERSVSKKYRKEIWNPFIAAVKRYELVEAGDRIAVCVSGGKDSFLCAALMRMLQRFSEVPFELVYLSMDPGYQPQNRQKIEENAALLELPLTVFETDIFDVANKTAHSPATSAPGCGGGICTAKRRSWAATRSPWATISAT